MSPDEKKWLHIRLEIILEQAQMIRHMADTTGDQSLFAIVENVRAVVENSARKAGLTKTKKDK